MEPRLLKKYKKEVIPAMRRKFGYKNNLTVPKVEKVVVNIGISKALEDPKFLDIMIDNLKKITGQAPVKTKARKSISNFKIREGMTVGLKVTLRGNRMYEFLDKLVNIVLPRVRDFRGLDLKGFDKHGNYTIGIKEHVVFPEINPNEVEKLHGLEITVTTTARDDKNGKELLELLGFPFKKK